MRCVGGKKNKRGDGNLKKGTFGGGGAKGIIHNYDAGSGGGYSGVYLGKPAGKTNLLVAVAGGGGSSFWGGRSYKGGAGGITKGQDGEHSTDGEKTDSSGGTWNGPGTNTGKGGTSDDRYKTGKGSFLKGGTSNGGGGGGSGFYGGGGGGNSGSVAPGAGGSSYYR